MIHDVQQAFRRQFGFPPTYTVHAPAVVELLGSYADLNHSLTLAMAVDRTASVSVAARTDGKVEVFSTDQKAPETFSVLDTNSSSGSATTRAIKATLNALRQRQAHCSGFSAAIHSTIPPGSGLGSSHALMVATALAVRQLHPYTLTATGVTVPPKRATHDAALPSLSVAEKIEIARTCLLARNAATPSHSGLVAPITSLFGKAFQAIEFDAQSLAVELVPFHGEVAWVLCDTGLRHAEIEKAVLGLRAEFESAARTLGLKSLRSADPAQLKAKQHHLTERQFQCASHVVAETQRVVAATRALREGDFAQFGQFMFQSHESSRSLLGTSSPEIDELIALAKIHPGCLGARLTGRGFGGATLNLVHRAQAESFVKAIATVYEKRTGRSITPIICKPAEGAN